MRYYVTVGPVLKQPIIDFSAESYERNTKLFGYGSLYRNIA